jgi:hypothetical protein
VTDPVKAIQTVKHRLARLAALQTLTALLPPALVLAGAALCLRTLGFHTWERLGLFLGARSESHLQTGLLAAAGLGAIASAVTAWRSFRRSNDSIRAAELIDRKLGCREEVLTLATMAGDAASSLRSPLFPVLWRRAAQYMDKLNPVRRVFPFRAGPPLKQALFLSVCTLALLVTGITVLLAANHPPLGAEARQIRKLAREIANSANGAESRDVTDRLKAVADMLEDPKVPPEVKLEQLASLERELKAQQERRQQQRQQDAAGKSQETTAKGNQARGSGQGKEGSGQGKEGSGQGKEGSGPGQGQGKGTGQGAGSDSAKEHNGDKQLAQARKDISKVQAQLEAEAAKRNSAQRSDSGGQKGRSPKAGEQPDMASLESAKNRPDLGRIKTGSDHGREENRNPGAQAAQTRRDFGSSRGDTHLGQFPQPGNFERFYKAGEHGPPLDIRNARYVLFRIPPAAQSGGGKGKSVIDNERTSATVPYENLPLKDERIAAEPDERQLVPPRYRDLLR